MFTVAPASYRLRSFVTLGALVAMPTFILACGRDPSPSAPPAAPPAQSAVTGAQGSAGAGSSTPTGAVPAAGELAVGKPAPSFELTAHDGASLKLSELKGKNVVVYFYPKDETPGCTREACAFRDAWSDLGKANVVLIGVSTDTVESHKKFAEHQKLPFHLVSDPDGALAKSFGVPSRGPFLARQTIVIGPDGNVKKIYRDVDVSKHAAEILTDVRS